MDDDDVDEEEEEESNWWGIIFTIKYWSMFRSR